MSWTTGVSYIYDGTFDGLLTCVFESYERKEELADISSAEEPQAVLFAPRTVVTCQAKAERVYKSIARNISPQAQDLIRCGFLTCAPQKELLIYRFLRIGFRVGGQVMQMLTEPSIHQLNKAVRHLKTESHAFMGFVRFSIHDDVLVAVIEPKNRVLPLIAGHFCQRFAGDTFLIYDKHHGEALMYRHDAQPEERLMMLNADEISIPEADEKEEGYRRLWKRFYDTVAIQERINPRARLSHMPKRYWAHLTEMQEE